MRLSVKLGALCAAAALLPLLLAWVVVQYTISTDSRELAAERLRSDARVAANIYQKRLVELRLASERLAEEIAGRAAVNTASADRDSGAALARLQDLLPRAQYDLSLDFVIVADPQGRVIARHNSRPAPGETLTGPNYKNPVAERALAEGAQSRTAPVVSTVLEPPEQIERLDLSMLAQVARADGPALDQALVLEAGAPVVAQGRLIGMVLLGQMLNTYYSARPAASALQTPIIAEVRQTLYGIEGRLSGAAISLGDTIIASSVPGDEASSDPALKGTKRDPSRTEETVRDGGRGYAVAWQPIKSLDGSQIGAIGAVVPEGALEGAAASLRAIFISAAVLALIVGGAGGLMFGNELAERLSVLTEAAGRMSVGELSTPVRDPNAQVESRIKTLLARDEVATLADRLDQMRESFRQAIERMRKR
ncbi:MAG TPA: hypothetical protein VNH22_20340 [Blastocatellia bacterium]|jgi:HAMP domain-containing protein|nr:hypothetical protein [Blastocatellia bacterium]